MAIFRITPATSVLTAGAGQHAFADDTAAADTLIVDAGAHLIATGAGAVGASLANTLAWRVTVNGWLFSQQSDGIHLAAGNAALSTVTIGIDGEVGGAGGAGIRADSAIKLVNSGLINDGVVVNSTTTIINNAAGTISNDGFAIVLPGGSEPITIRNAGTIKSLSSASILDLGSQGNNSIANTGNIIGRINLGDGNNALVNSGTLDGLTVGVAYIGGSGNDTVTNSKTIIGRVELGFGGSNVLTNRGTIDASLVLDAVWGGNGSDIVTNSNLIIGSVLLRNGTNRLTNSGTILGSVTAGDGDDTIVNTRMIDPPGVGHVIDMGAGNNVLTNRGTIASSVAGGGGNDVVTNGNLIADNVALGDGTNRLTNSGTIGGIVLLGNGDDTIINSKTIGGEVTLGDGNNVLINRGTVGSDPALVNVTGGAGTDIVTNGGKGIILGIVDLGAGDDSFTGANAADTVRDADGSDTFKLGGGADAYLAKRTGGGDGTDIVDGGTGIDTYDANDATSSLLINVDTVDHDFTVFGFPGLQFQTRNTANGTDVDGGAGAKDTITNFENVKGGSAGDVIYGSRVANVIEGNGGSDTLFGFGGNDTLVGGSDADFLVGGAGRDTLDGGVDGASDRFFFTAVSDSTVGKAGRDQIVNFEDSFDFIDLSVIDAQSGTPTDDAFTYLNGNSVSTPAVAFSGNGIGGELRSIWTATGYVLEGDVNGDGRADFAIDIVDPAHTIILTSADFFL